MSPKRIPMLLAVAASLLVLATALAAQSLPRLPGPMPLARGADSPGEVTFTHATHVDEASPNCTACHPKMFPILKGDAKKRPAITHARMEKGELCGSCHNGKKSFAFEDDCTLCHKDESK